MRLKELEGHLQPLRGFAEPKVELEQYVTSAHLAAHMIFTAATAFDDVSSRTVLDLGCGCGILSIASAMMGASHVVGVDVDDAALEVARSNLEESECQEEVELIKADVEDFTVRGGIETVVMNPPFGTKTKGVDMVFLEKACKIAEKAVYSLHKTSTRSHIERRAKDFGFSSRVLAELRVRYSLTLGSATMLNALMQYDLPKTLKMHKQKSLDIQVDLWRFERIRPPSTT